MKLRLRDWLLSRRSQEKAEDVNDELVAELKKMSDTLTFTAEEMKELNNQSPHPRQCKTKRS